MSIIEDLGQITVKTPTHPEDNQWLRDLWHSEWGGETMVVGGSQYRLDNLDAFIAWLSHRRVGAATATVHSDKSCELISLNATQEGRGIGTILLEHVEQFALGSGCSSVKVITTNDNLQALKFYQKRGYRLAAVQSNAIDEARKQKPEIPLVGKDGIPLHDELILQKVLRKG